MDKLLAKLSEQKAVLHQQNEALKSANGDAMFSRGPEKPSSGSLPITPAADSMAAAAGSLTRPASATSQAASDELLRLKLELAQAQNKISHLEAQTRLVQPDSGRGTPVGLSGGDLSASALDLPLNRFPLPNPPNGGGSRLPFPRDGGWPGQDDSRLEPSDPFPAGPLTRTKTIWNSKPAYMNAFPQAAPGPIGGGPQPVPWSNPRSSNQAFNDPTRSFSPTDIEPFGTERLTPDPDMMRPSSSRRGNRFDNRFGSNNAFGSNFGSYMGGGTYDGAAGYGNGAQGGMTSSMAMSLFPPYQQQSMTSPLSPHASEFTSAGPPWVKTEVSTLQPRSMLFYTVTQLTSFLQPGSGPPWVKTEVSTLQPR
jgi:hypothetical protein